MWRTMLTCSVKQYFFIALFYLVLIILSMMMFSNTYFDDVIFIVVILLVIEWWKACCYLSTIKDKLILFYEKKELYWAEKRWHIVRKPIFFRYAVIIHLRLKGHHERRILFLVNDSLSLSDWRSLHYFLHQFIED